MTKYDKTDKMITICALAAIAIFGIGAIGLMAINQEAVGETTACEPLTVDVSLPGTAEKWWYGNDYVCHHPSARIIDRFTFDDGVSQQTWYDVPQLLLDIEIPSHDESFRYFKLEYSSPGADYVNIMHANGFSAVREGPTEGYAVYSVPKGDYREHETQHFDNIRVTLANADSVEITCTVGLSDGKTIEEHVTSFTYHLVQQDPAS